MTSRQRVGVIAAAVLVVLAAAGFMFREPVGNYVDMLQAMRSFGKANTAYERKEFEEAIGHYESATANVPADNALVQTTLRFFSGSSHYLVFQRSRDKEADADHLDHAVGHFEATIDTVQSAVADPAMDAEGKEAITLYELYASEQLAAIYRDEKKDLEQTEKYMNRLIELYPDQPARYYSLAQAYQSFHDPTLEEDDGLLEKAVEAYKKPVELNPEDPIAYRQVASLLNNLGRFDETMEWLEQARDVNPQNPEGYYLIATYYWDKVYRDPDLTQRGRADFVERGIDQLDQAIELNDEYVDALIYKNLLLREKAKLEPNNSSTLIAMADELRARAIELREAQQAAAAAEAAAAAAGAAAAAAAAAEAEAEPEG